MATLTINVIPPHEKYRLMKRIVDLVSQSGSYQSPQSNSGINYVSIEMEHYGIIKRENMQQGWEFIKGEHFLEAKLVGPKKFIRRINRKLNPNLLLKIWDYISNNSLLSGMLGGMISYGLIKLTEFIINQ